MVGVATVYIVNISGILFASASFANGFSVLGRRVCTVQYEEPFHEPDAKSTTVIVALPWF